MVTEWLGDGLQNHLRRFDSVPSLHELRGATFCHAGGGQSKGYEGRQAGNPKPLSQIFFKKRLDTILKMTYTII